MPDDDLNRTPLFDWHVAHGARMVPFAGWEMPLQYEGIAAEHVAVRTRVGQFDLMHMGVVEITGASARDAVSACFTNDIARASVGRAQYSMLTETSGEVVDDVMVYWLHDERFLVVVNAANHAPAAELISQRCGAVGATFVDRAGDLGVLAVQGPFAREVLESMGVGASALRRFDVVPSATVAGVDVTLSRTGYTGEDGFELLTPRAAAVEVWSATLAAGQSWGSVPIGLGARDTLRMEAGLPLYGHELSRSITPFEAGLGGVVSFDHDFAGRDALLAQSNDARRRLAGLRLSQNRIARPDSVVSGPSGTGVVTSGAFSFSANQSIALALVPVAWEAGTDVTVDVRGNPVPAVLVDLPFHRAERRKAATAT